MAKETQKARVRVFFGEIEGDDQTIRDGLRSIAAAVEKTFQPSTKLLALSSSRDSEPTKAAAPEVVSQANDPPPADVELDGERPGNNGARRSRKPATYTLVKDLDLRPDGKQGLKAFVQEKRPQDMQETLAVLVYYLERILGVPAIGPNHLYTAFKELGNRVPKDLLGLCRNTASRKGWIDTSNSECLKITVAGENFVEQDLPDQAARAEPVRAK